MRIGVIGLGSMGKRRARDLLALGCEVMLFDSRSDRIVEAQKIFNASAVSSFDALVEKKPDALVI